MFLLEKRGRRRDLGPLDRAAYLLKTDSRSVTKVKQYEFKHNAHEITHATWLCGYSIHMCIFNLHVFIENGSLM